MSEGFIQDVLFLALCMKIIDGLKSIHAHVIQLARLQDRGYHSEPRRPEHCRDCYGSDYERSCNQFNRQRFALDSQVSVLIPFKLVAMPDRRLLTP